MANKTVKLLDCTLRDGGYINDWDFGHSVITGTYKRLSASGVDYIEVGFLDDRRTYDINRTIQPNMDCFNEIFNRVEKTYAMPLVMIDFGTCDISNIPESDATFIDGIRVIFKKEKINQALPFCQAIKEKGYKLFIQAISITDYSELDMLEYVQRINEVKPYAFSIVDTYGLLDAKKLTNYFELIDCNLDSEIIIGYHAHNNFQLAFSNSIRFLELETTRTLVVDSTVYGMGKSAGNCASELISMHMNELYGKKYDINQFLEILDTDLLPVYQKHYWGYKYNFYISAMQNCHPNYVQFLLDKKTLSVSSINEILSAIPKNIKLRYSENYIRNAYLEYQSHYIDDSGSIDELYMLLKGKKIVILGPGSTLSNDKAKIEKFIDTNSAIVISVNFKPDAYKCDYVFISNAKRYSKLSDIIGSISGAKIILTSNITAYDRPADYMLNYQSLISLNKLNCDNSLILCMWWLVKINVKEVFLAGFDGFTAKETDYYQLKYAFCGNEGYRVYSNQIISSCLKELSKKMDITFITQSIYENFLS